MFSPVWFLQNQGEQERNVNVFILCVFMVLQNALFCQNKAAILL